VNLPVLTNSRLSCAKSCRRKHYFRYELGVRPQSDAVYFRIGGAFHKGVELRRKGLDQDAAILEAVASYETLPGWAKTPEQIHDWMTERETVVSMLAGYFWRWQGDADQIAETVAAELPFELPIVNPETGKPTTSFRLSGKIDGIVKLKDGRLAIHEIKTTSDDIEPLSDYWKRLRIDHQITTYVYAARKLGYAVETVYYDVAKKPDIRPKQIPLLDDQGFKIVLDAAGQRVMTKDGKKPRETGDTAAGYTLQTRIEEPAEFRERFMEDIEARPDHYFVRQEIPRLDADIEEFEHELWSQQQELRDAQKSGRWYRNTSSCVGFGKCEYFDVCTNSITITRENPPTGFVAVDDLHPELRN